MRPIQLFRARGATGGGGSPPGIADVVHSSKGGISDSHNVSMPASVGAGDLLVVAIVFDDNISVTTPSGWAQAFSTYDGINTGFLHKIYTKTASGSEGGTVVDFLTSGNSARRSISVCVRIPGGTDVERTTGLVNGSSNAAIPSFNPSWAAQNTAWLVFVSAYSDATVTSYPLPDNTNRTSVTSTFSAYFSTKLENIETIAPSNIVLSAGVYGFTQVIAVKVT